MAQCQEWASFSEISQDCDLVAVVWSMAKMRVESLLIKFSDKATLTKTLGAVIKIQSACQRWAMAKCGHECTWEWRVNLWRLQGSDKSTSVPLDSVLITCQINVWNKWSCSKKCGTAQAFQVLREDRNGKTEHSNFAVFKIRKRNIFTEYDPLCKTMWYSGE